MTLQDIYKPISQDLLLIEKEIHQQISDIASEHQISGDIINYFFDTPGKYLRPALLLFSAYSLAPAFNDKDKLIKLGVAIELIHNASLVHDDILDEADTRREKLSLNKKFGNKIAVLTGNILYSQALIILNSHYKKEIVDLFLKCVKIMSNGEIFNLQTNISNQEDYIEVIIAKTAFFMSTCCQAGAILTTEESAIISCLQNYGNNFGIAYQLIDDTIDNDIPKEINIDNMALASKHIDLAVTGLKKIPESLYKESLIKLADYIFNKDNSGSYNKIKDPEFLIRNSIAI